MNFNIRSIVPSEVAFMQIRDIEGNLQYAEDGSKPGIEFYGPGTREGRAAQNYYLSNLKRLIDKKNKDNELQEVERLKTAYVTKMTKRFVGFEIEGDMADFYGDPEFAHVTEDAYKFVGEQGNFKKSS